MSNAIATGIVFDLSRHANAFNEFVNASNKVLNSSRINLSPDLQGILGTTQVKNDSTVTVTNGSTSKEFTVGQLHADSVKSDVDAFLTAQSLCQASSKPVTSDFTFNGQNQPVGVGVEVPISQSMLDSIIPANDDIGRLDLSKPVTLTCNGGVNLSHDASNKKLVLSFDQAFDASKAVVIYSGTSKSGGNLQGTVTFKDIKLISQAEHAKNLCTSFGQDIDKYLGFIAQRKSNSAVTPTDTETLKVLLTNTKQSLANVQTEDQFANIYDAYMGKLAEENNKLGSKLTTLEAEAQQQQQSATYTPPASPICLTKGQATDILSNLNLPNGFTFESIEVDQANASKLVIDQTTKSKVTVNADGDLAVKVKVKRTSDGAITEHPITLKATQAQPGGGGAASVTTSPVKAKFTKDTEVKLPIANKPGTEIDITGAVYPQETVELVRKGTNNSELYVKFKKDVSDPKEIEIKDIKFLGTDDRQKTTSVKVQPGGGFGMWGIGASIVGAVGALAALFGIFSGSEAAKPVGVVGGVVAGAGILAALQQAFGFLNN